MESTNRRNNNNEWVGCNLQNDASQSLWEYRIPTPFFPMKMWLSPITWSVRVAGHLSSLSAYISQQYQCLIGTKQVMLCYTIPSYMNALWRLHDAHSLQGLTSSSIEWCKNPRIKPIYMEWPPLTICDQGIQKRHISYLQQYTTLPHKKAVHE